jgi:NADH:ubiquinone oxidoreductase subunit 4 (subunit M)
VVVKELSVWTGFIATSAWSLLWVAEYLGARVDDLIMHAFAFSLPLVLLAILVARLERQYESAYVGVVTGLAQEQPRMTGIFVVVILAVIGSPLFPSFFSLLSNINNVVMVMPSIALAIVLVWLLWSWSGIRLLQELVVGDPAVIQYDDISHSMTIVFFISFVLLVAGGLYMSEVLL